MSTIKSERMDSTQFDWNDPANVAKLTELWATDLSTAEIGRRMGCSKNVVVGKAHRLGLPARPSPIVFKTKQNSQNYEAKRKREAYARAKVVMPTLPVLPSGQIGHYRVLVRGHVRWTDEGREAVRQCAAEGLTLQGAAERLGVTTLCIGQCAGKLGLRFKNACDPYMRRPHRRKDPDEPPQLREPRKPKPVAAKPKAPFNTGIKAPPYRERTHLAADCPNRPAEPCPDGHGCQFPLGTPGKPGFRLCSAPTPSRRVPYCDHCAGLVYHQPGQTGQEAAV